MIKRLSCLFEPHEWMFDHEELGWTTTTEARAFAPYFQQFVDHYKCRRCGKTETRRNRTKYHDPLEQAWAAVDEWKAAHA